MARIEIREHRPGRDLDAFIQVAYLVYNGDPAWVPPLDVELRRRLSPGANPFFDQGEVALFTAWKNGEVVGRISAQLDHVHLAKFQDRVGFFGFFDTIDDDEVGHALLNKAEEWLRSRGMKKMRGPLSFHIYEEAGLLVEGYEHPPQILMAHSRPWQKRILEGAGFSKARDLFAWRFEVGKVPGRAEKAWEEIRQMPEVRFRTVNRLRLREELQAIIEVFNDAWEGNWGHRPASDKEVEKIGRDLLPILDPELSFIAEIDGKPMGICICLPNLNEVIRDFQGRLGPVEIAKLIWRLKIRRPQSGRLMMLGIRKELRHVKRYGGLSHAIYVELAKRGERLGYKWGELSWTLEDNHPINAGIRSMGAKLYKKYRIYERSIDA
ncbi:MAG: hypothetical protein N2515_08320 [Deltaproteobacteria bacterium]|nr:hypothetical protein [Deltaproteobacteria bacterium]